MIFTTSCNNINKTTTKLANIKAPGINGVPRNVFNTFDVVNISCLLIFYNQFWHIQADFDKWNEGQAVHVTKKSNTPYPNKWRGVTSMDIGKNIYSSIMCRWLFMIIGKHGVKCQFGSTPGVGYQYVTFTIKTLLHLRHNHNLPTWVAFVDLVKAFGTSNHALIFAKLGKHGAPPRIFS